MNEGAPLPLCGSQQTTMKSQDLPGSTQGQGDYEETGERSQSSIAGELAIDLKDLSFSYPKGQPVLHALSWQVPAGSFSVLCGPTGSGKSTLLRLLKPELTPAGSVSGHMVVLGRKPNQWHQIDSAAEIGYVAQSPESQVVCDMVWHELSFGLESLGVSEQGMRRRVAGVAQFLGLESLVDRKCSELSGGELQEVAFASVLALQPRLLLLDEPTSQLDPPATKNFLHLLFRVNHELGITVVICTHEPEACLDYATSCFSLTEGRISPVNIEALRQRSKCKAKTYGRGAPLDARVEVSFHDVWFRYAKTAPDVLRGADIDIVHSSIHALVGGSGSGKTTALQIMAGVYQPQRGSAHNSLLSNQILLPQDPKALFVCDTVEEELREWQKASGYSDGRIREVARHANLDKLLQLNPYDLSGGQQQALAFSKLILCDPQLLLLDEPTKGLDPSSRLALAHDLARLADKGSTIVVATHDLSFVSRVADHVSLLFDGKVACTQTTADFFRDNLFFQPLYDGFAALWDEGDA